MKPKYQFPSAFEVEKPLRRDYVAGMNRAARRHYVVRAVGLSIVAAILLGLLVLSILPVLAAGPMPEPSFTWNGEKGTKIELCARYRNEELQYGRKMERATAEMCGFDTNN